MVSEVVSAFTATTHAKRRCQYPECGFISDQRVCDIFRAAGMSSTPHLQHPTESLAADVAALLAGAASPSSRASRRRKPCSSRNGEQFSLRLAGLASSIGNGSGASSRRCTSWRETRAISAWFCRFSRRFGWVISPARSSRSSRLPGVDRSAAVLTPIPARQGRRRRECRPAPAHRQPFPAAHRNVRSPHHGRYVSLIRSSRRRGGSAASGPCRKKR